MPAGHPQSRQIKLSPESERFVRELLEGHIREVLDDPASACEGTEIKETFEDWRRLSEDLGFDLDRAIADLGNPQERRRLGTLLSRGRQRCARDSDWCDGRICRELGVDCPNADKPMFPMPALDPELQEGVEG